MTIKEQLFADLEKDSISSNYNQITRAKNGDDDAMYNIGTEYYDKQKHDKALAWYRLAADKNNSSAQYCIGSRYKNGDGVPQDYLVAMEWYLKAAIQNNKLAWGNIGYLFELGQGVPVNKYKALEWYYKLGEDSYGVERLTKQGIQLTQQDKNKSLEQLIMETKDIAWPGGRFTVEKQQMNKMEEESTAKDSKIKALKEENQTLRLISQRQQRELVALKKENHTLELKMETKDNKVALLEKEIKLLQIALENSSQGTNKRIKELERSNQSVERMLEQEKQPKDSQIELLKQKIEFLSETEKQKRRNLEKENRARKRELKSIRASTQGNTPHDNNSIKNNNDTSDSNNDTDYDTGHNNNENNSNDINYDTPDDNNGEDNNDLNYDSDDQIKNKIEVALN